jgi:hypothetical protein
LFLGARLPTKVKASTQMKFITLHTILPLEGAKPPSFVQVLVSWLGGKVGKDTPLFQKVG